MKEEHMMTKWDTIQADVADAYVYLDEQDEQDEQDEDLACSKCIEINARADNTDHLTDEQIEMVSTMFETREAD